MADVDDAARAGTPVDHKRPHAPKAAADEHGLDLDDIHRKRIEKDLQELQRLIEQHFLQRKNDESELEELRVRIEQRKEMREEQIRVRQEREKQRMEREKEERKRKEEEETRRRVEEEEKKKQALASMSVNYGGYMARAENSRKGKRATERDKKKKILAERRKPLNIDHLAGEKLKEKANELHAWLSTLEEERYDLEHRAHRQKYDVNQMRMRVNELMSKKKGGMKHVGKLKK